MVTDKRSEQHANKTHTHTCKPTHYYFKFWAMWVRVRGLGSWAGPAWFCTLLVWTLLNWTLLNWTCLNWDFVKLDFVKLDFVKQYFAKLDFVKLDFAKLDFA